MILYNAIVAWHDPRSDEIKYNFVWVNPTAPPSGYGSTPVGATDEDVANELEKSSSSGRPAVAVLAPGGLSIDEAGFVIVWEDASGHIRARVFHSKGRPTTPECIIYDASPAAASSVIATRNGFYVVWMDFEGNTDAPLWAIKGQFWEVKAT
jgi:hypothetical protein